MNSSHRQSPRTLLNDKRCAIIPYLGSLVSVEGERSELRECSLRPEQDKYSAKALWLYPPQSIQHHFYHSFCEDGWERAGDAAASVERQVLGQGRVPCHALLAKLRRLRASSRILCRRAVRLSVRMRTSSRLPSWATSSSIGPVSALYSHVL